MQIRDVIEKQYEEIKNGIKFRIENNITDDWEQIYYLIGVLCEKHKERIRGIEYGICAIEELKQQLTEKDKEIENLKLCKCVPCTNEYEFMLKGLVEDLEKQIDRDEQDKISFAVEQLRQLKIDLNARRNEYYTEKGYKKFACSVDFINTTIDNQIKQLKEI